MIKINCEGPYKPDYKWRIKCWFRRNLPLFVILGVMAIIAAIAIHQADRVMALHVDAVLPATVAPELAE